MTHLKSLRINYTSNAGLPHAERLPPGIEGQRQLAYIRSISKVISRMNAPMIFFEYALQSSKIVMSAPPTTHVTLLLSRDPRPGLDYEDIGKVKNIQIDLEFDPAKLLDIPQTNKTLGEFALGCWEQAIQRLEAETDFPADFIREQMEMFRAQGYVLDNTLKPVTIVGTKAKARIHGEVGCARTVLKVEVAYRKKVLFERVIWDTPEQAFNIAYSKRECVVEGGQFKVRAARMGLLPEASFPLETLPEEFLKTIS